MENIKDVINDIDEGIKLIRESGIQHRSHFSQGMIYAYKTMKKTLLELKQNKEL